MKRWRLIFPIALLTLPALLLSLDARAIELNVERGTVSGRIFEAGTGHGIPNLVVKLIPSRQLQAPQKITATNADGGFKFVDLRDGRYLLEVYQGITILHRSVLDTNVETHKVIELRRKQ